jgi:hypothetical protein
MMNDLEEPRRLLENDGAPAGLRALLQRAHEDVPASATVDLLVRAAEQRVRVPPPKMGMRRMWAAHGSRHAAKFLVAAAIVGAGAGAWYWAGGQSSKTGTMPEVRAAIPETPSLQEPARPAPPSPVTPPAVAADTVRAAPSGQVRSRVRRPVRTSEGPVASETETTVSLSTSIDTPTRASTEEYRLLRSARQALVQNPALALRLTDEHARRYQHGMLAQEREAIAVEALVHLGRDGQARDRAHVFLAAYPSSPYRGRVEAAFAQVSAAKRP